MEVKKYIYPKLEVKKFIYPKLYVNLITISILVRSCIFLKVKGLLEKVSPTFSVGINVLYT